MSQIGYYRIKTFPSTEGEAITNIFVNGALTLTAKVIAKKWCDNYRLVKYLDRSGKYRFFPFNNHWQKTDTPTAIGTVNKFVTSILSDQSSTRSVGYKNTRKMSLTAGDVSADEIEVLSDIYYSPRVYLYVGSGTDKAADWVLVTITGDGISRMKKNNFKKVTIDVTLPEFYSIRM